MPPPTNFSLSCFRIRYLEIGSRMGKHIKKEEKDHHYSEVTEAKILSTCLADFLKTKQNKMSTFLNAGLSHFFQPKKEADLNWRYISNGNS